MTIDTTRTHAIPLFTSPFSDCNTEIPTPILHLTYISRGNLSLDVVGLGGHAEGRRGVGAAGGGGGGQLTLEGGAGSAADGESSGRGDACCGDGEGGLELHGWCLSGDNNNKEWDVDRKRVKARRSEDVRGAMAPAWRRRTSPTRRRGAHHLIFLSSAAAARGAGGELCMLNSPVTSHQSPVTAFTLYIYSFSTIGRIPCRLPLHSAAVVVVVVVVVATSLPLRRSSTSTTAAIRRR